MALWLPEGLQALALPDPGRVRAGQPVRQAAKEINMAPYVIVRSIKGERFSQSVETGKHRLIADKQTSFGGSDRGPGPYAYLLAALGS